MQFKQIIKTKNYNLVNFYEIVTQNKMRIYYKFYRQPNIFLHEELIKHYAHQELEYDHNTKQYIKIQAAIGRKLSLL